MDAQSSQQAAAVILCLTCVSPALLGLIVGAWLQRRILAKGSLAAALVPGFVVRWLEKKAAQE
jgi:hypothetical protein